MSCATYLSSSLYSGTESTSLQPRLLMSTRPRGRCNFRKWSSNAAIAAFHTTQICLFRYVCNVGCEQVSRCRPNKQRNIAVGTNKIRFRLLNISQIQWHSSEIPPLIVFECYWMNTPGCPCFPQVRVLRSCHRPSFPLEFNILCQHQTHLPAVRTEQKTFPIRAGRMRMRCRTYAVGRGFESGQLLRMCVHDCQRYSLPAGNECHCASIVNQLERGSPYPDHFRPQWAQESSWDKSGGTDVKNDTYRHMVKQIFATGLVVVNKQSL